MARNAVKRGFSVLPEDLIKIEKIVEKDFGGNFSKMITTVLMSYVASHENPLSNQNDCLQQLVQDYCPALGQQAEELLAGVDQQSLTTKLIEALVESFRIQAEATTVGNNIPYDVWVKAIPKAQSVKDGILKSLSEMPPPTAPVSLSNLQSRCRP